MRSRISATLDKLELLMKQADGKLQFRLSINEICRRATVHKNTLRASYYRDLRARADRLVMLASGDTKGGVIKTRRDRQNDIEVLVQKLAAAEILKDQALARVAELENEIQSLRLLTSSQSAPGNILPFK